jgi:ubiquilin
MLTFRSSSDKKEELTIEPSQTVRQVKELVSQKFDIPTDRLRLIYSGRVLKDDDLVEKYNIKPGVTIHVVKGAAPPTSSSGTTSNSSGASVAASNPSDSSTTAVPTNIAAGQGTGNLLADLTGARYAGLANLPSASMFGPDGGMGPTPSPEDMLSIMETPGFAENLQQVLQNPQMVDMMINSNPQLRHMAPQFRQMMQSEGFRNMLSNPDMLRQMLQMDQMFRGTQGGGAGFPAPGTTETASAAATSPRSNTGNSNLTGQAAANPFAALFPNGMPPVNPFAFGGAGGASTGTTTGASTDSTTGTADNTGMAPNPFFNPALLANMFGAGNNPPQPEDNRPPEERYESQLRQLNELGFFDFERNVRALRRSGGNVQGAVEALLDGQV